MKLPNRLKLISEKVNECEKVCDVGTDHAYVPIHLVREGVCKGAIATDVKKGPLLRAQRNIARFGLVEHIETRLGDGLDSIEPGECDSVVIAGMGGLLISQILQKGLEVVKRAKSLVIQPMYIPELVRKWLFENGFKITDEALVAEGTKIYLVICATYDGTKRNTDELYYRIGENLIKKKGPLLQDYILRMIQMQQKVVSGLCRAKDSDAHEIDRQNEMLMNMKLLYSSIFDES